MKTLETVLVLYEFPRNKVSPFSKVFNCESISIPSSLFKPIVTKFTHTIKSAEREE